jgi:predicted Zn-dependent protease
VYASSQLLGNFGGMTGNTSGGKGQTPARQKTLSASTKLAAKQLNWLPMSAEKLYGERLHQEDVDNVLSRDNARAKKLYAVADKMLQEILSTVGEPHDYEFKLFILKSDNRNALARPGGYLYIDRGLIDSQERYQKAYFALAHEIAHVLQRHETMSVQSMVIDSVTYEEQLTQLISGINRNPNLILSRVKLGKNQFSRYHIDQELQADACGTKLLSRAFPDQQQLAGILNAFLKDLPPPEPAKPVPAPRSDAERLSMTVHDIVDTPVKRHPNTQERQNNLRAIYGEIAKSMAARGR